MKGRRADNSEATEESARRTICTRIVATEADARFYARRKGRTFTDCYETRIEK